MVRPDLFILWKKRSTKFKRRTANVLAYLSESSFLLQVWFIQRHFSQNFQLTVNFPICSSLTLAPGISSGESSTCSYSPVMLFWIFTARAIKPYLHATSGFFLEYYKLIHRTLVTKKELHMFGIENNNRCFYCDESDSILHTFLECFSLSFMNKVVEWFNQTNNCMLSPTLIEKPFGIELVGCNDNNNLELNYCLLFAKYYLYYQKTLTKPCIFNKFIKKLQWKLKLKVC